MKTLRLNAIAVLSFLACMVMHNGHAEDNSRSFQAFLHTGFNQVKINDADINTYTTRISLSWLLAKSWSLDTGYSLVLSSEGSSNFTGYDLGFRYFFNHQASFDNFSKEGSTITHRPTLAPYLGGIFAQRSLKLNSTNIEFTGPGIRTGFMMNWRKKFLIDVAFEMLNLKGPLGTSETNEFKSNQISVGLGLPF